MTLRNDQICLIFIIVAAIVGFCVYLIVCLVIKKCDKFTLPSCASHGQDPYYSKLYADGTIIPAQCCDGQKKVLVDNSKWICPGGGSIGTGASVSGNFPILKKFNLGNLDEFNVEVMSDSGMTNSCANYTKDGVFSRNGSLVLKVTDQGCNGGCLNSGRVHSNDKFKYGIFEFDAKVPKCNGVWPAIWLLPIYPAPYGASWPCYGEIDIMETTDTMPWSTFNVVAGQGGKVSSGNVDCSGNDCGCSPYCLQSTMVDWEGSRMYVGPADCANKTWPQHKYVFYWEPGRMISYIDPVITRNSDGSISSITPSNITDPSDISIKSYKIYTFDSTPTWQAGSKWANNCYKGIATKYAPFDSPMNLMFNIAIGGYGDTPPCGWGTKCNASPCKDSIGSEMVISNITVYSLL